MPGKHLDKRDGGEEPNEGFPFINVERMPFFAGDDSLADGDRCVRNRGEMSRPLAEQVLVEVEQKAGGDGDDRLLAKGFANRGEDLVDKVGLHRNNDKVAVFDHFSRRFESANTKGLATLLERIEMCGACSDTGPFYASALDKTLGHGACHVSETDESDACRSSVHDAPFNGKDEFSPL